LRRLRVEVNRATIVAKLESSPATPVRVKQVVKDIVLHSASSPSPVSKSAAKKPSRSSVKRPTRSTVKQPATASATKAPKPAAAVKLAAGQEATVDGAASPVLKAKQALKRKTGVDANSSAATPPVVAAKRARIQSPAAETKAVAKGPTPPANKTPVGRRILVARKTPAAKRLTAVKNLGTPVQVRQISENEQNFTEQCCRTGMTLERNKNC
jgi:hypothetical protein